MKPNQATAKPDLSLVPTLAGLASHYGKRYCYPSQDKIIELHARRTNVRRSRRTLNRHLAGLAGQGWIKRTRRHTRAPGRGFEFRSTLYTMTRRAYRWLATLAQAARDAIGWGRVTLLSQHFPTRDNNSGHPPANRGAGPPSDVALAALALLKGMKRA